MGAFSSKPKKVPTPEISAVDRAVLDLKNARDRLRQYRKKLEQDDAKLVAQAKKARDAGKKQQALGILRLRKYKEVQATNCENQLLNVLQMVETIDSKQNEAQVLSALAAGKDTLKKMHEERTVDDVLDLMDAVREEIEVEQEINQILQGVPTLSPEDEEAAIAELQALEGEKIELPIAPTGGVPKIEVRKETAEEPKETRVAVPG